MIVQATLLAVALIGAQASQDRKIDYICPGLALPQLAAELSRVAGVRLEAPAVFGKDIVIVRAKDVTLKELMGRIADIAAGEWQSQDGGYVLTLSQEKLRGQAQAERNAAIEGFARALDSEKKKIAQLHAWDAQEATSVAVALQELLGSSSDTSGNFDQNLWQRVQLLEDRAPLGRAMIRVLASLDPKTMADAPMGWRTVYSSNPTKMQRPLPLQLTQCLSDLAREQKLWSEIASKNISESRRPLMYYSPGLMARSPLPDQLGKTLLIVEKQSTYSANSGRIELIIADPKGRILMRGDRFLNDPSGRFEIPKPEPGEQPLEATPITKAIVRFFDGMEAQSEVEPVPADVMQMILHPEKFEPIGYGTGEMLIAMAEARNRNLIAETYDIAFLAGAFAAKQKLTPTGLFRSLNMMQLDTRDEGGWITVTPRGPVTARMERADRYATGQLVRSVAQNGRARLDELAAYAAHFAGSVYESLGYFLTMVQSGDRSSDMADADMLRFYGALTPGRRQALAAGQAVSLANLSANEKGALEKMVYSGRSDGGVTELAADGSQMSFGTISTEPTERYGEGIPPDSLLTMSIADESVLMAPSYRIDGNMYPSRGMTASEVAQVLLAKESPQWMPWYKTDPDWNKRQFTLATRRNLSFRFQLGVNGGTMTKQLQDYGPSKGAAVPYGQLPEDFRKQVDNALTELRQAYKNRPPRTVRGDSPPPAGF